MRNLRIAEGTREAKSSSPPIETKPKAEKKNVDIQPSKTHKSEETKKGTKIVVNSVIEQNVVSQADESKKIEVRKNKKKKIKCTLRIRQCLFDNRNVSIRIQINVNL